MRASFICARCVRAAQKPPARSQQVGIVISQRVCTGAPFQTSSTATFSTSRSRCGTNSLTEQPRPRRGRSWKPATFALAAVAIGAVSWYSLGSETEDDSLNSTKFTPFEIISREQISPTAFIITIRCANDVLPKNTAKLEAAWAYGLWSVEVKQPQLQIARHYTPLPPMDEAEIQKGTLRFLIRRMATGEMSNYLSRLQIGDKVWLRGPHYGFNIKKRMAAAKEVVFLAGGTGIAPALQLAHKLLDDSDPNSTGAKPSVRVLWANRSNVDSVGRDELSGKSTNSRDSSSVSCLTCQLTSLRAKHADKFSIEYFVDAERFVGPRDIETAIGKSRTGKVQPLFAAADKSCRWHSHERLTSVSDEEDCIETEQTKCTCRPHNMPEEPIGRNLICVSGPDGFIEAFAGSKRWFGGREIQGPVLGLLGSMKRLDPKMDDWLVLKL